VQDGTTFTVRLPLGLSKAPALEVQPHMRSAGDEEQRTEPSPRPVRG
jgi:hypothetical protein